MTFTIALFFLIMGQQRSLIPTNEQFIEKQQIEVEYRTPNPEAGRGSFSFQTDRTTDSQIWYPRTERF